MQQSHNSIDDVSGCSNRCYNGHCLLFQEHVAIQVVDGVVEDIRLGMEVSNMSGLTWRASSVQDAIHGPRKACMCFSPFSQKFPPVLPLKQSLPHCWH